MPERWIYPPEFLDALASSGLAPSSATPPALARRALDEFYKYELRRLRDRLRAGAIERADYLGHVIALRKKYWLLTLSEEAWNRICGAL